MRVIFQVFRDDEDDGAGPVLSVGAVIENEILKAQSTRQMAIDLIRLRLVRMADQVERLMIERRL